MDRRAFQEARDFVGADWESIKGESRVRLLEREGLVPGMARLPWKRLPETVKAALARSVMAGVKR